MQLFYLCISVLDTMEPAQYRHLCLLSSKNSHVSLLSALRFLCAPTLSLSQFLWKVPPSAVPQTERSVLLSMGQHNHQQSLLITSCQLDPGPLLSALWAQWSGCFPAVIVQPTLQRAHRNNVKNLSKVQAVHICCFPRSPQPLVSAQRAAVIVILWLIKIPGSFSSYVISSWGAHNFLLLIPKTMTLYFAALNFNPFLLFQSSRLAAFHLL